MKLSFPVDSGRFVSPSTPAAYAERINLYAAASLQESGSSRGALLSLPGFDLWAEGSYSSNLGCHVFQDELYILGSNGKFVKFDSSGTETVIGTLSTTSAWETHGAFFADNGQTLCFVIPGVASYFYDTTAGLVQITDATFQSWEAESGGVRTVTFIDGYFVFNTYKTVFKSSLVTTNGGKDFDASDFVRPFLRENARRVANVRGELYVFGENTTKVYSNVGGADFPFQEIPGATIDKGLEDTRGLIAFDNSFYFYGGGMNERASVWRGIGGGGVSKISTEDIDRVWDGADTVRHGEHFFSHDGRAFVGFYINGRTFWYDIVASQRRGSAVWIEYQNSYLSGGSGSASGPAYIECFGKILQPIQNRVLEIDTESSRFYQPGGTGAIPERRVRFTGQYLHAQSDPVIINRLELVMETGVGRDPDLAIEDTNPAVLLEFSDDGARTWKNAGEQSVGRSAKYGTRVVWPMLGLAPVSRIFRFTADTNVPMRFHRIDMEVEKGFLYG